MCPEVLDQPVDAAVGSVIRVAPADVPEDIGGKVLADYVGALLGDGGQELSDPHGSRMLRQRPPFA
jgi:hypothetical protein